LDSSLCGYCYHESRIASSHVSKMIALAAQRIAAGSGEFLEIGDISVQRVDYAKM